MILPASLVQIVLVGLSLTSSGGLSLALWASGMERFNSPSQRYLRSAVSWTGAEPSYVWATVYVVLAAVMLAGIAFGAHRMVTAALVAMPVPFATWVVLISLASRHDPKASLTGISAYAFIASVHVALAGLWIMMLRINPTGVLTAPRRHVVDDVSSRHPVALSLYVALPILGLLLGPLVVGSVSLDDSLSRSLQWQWSIEMTVGGIMALVGAALPLSKRFQGLYLERIGDVALVFGCLSYAAALFNRAGLSAIGPGLLTTCLAFGMLMRAVQITFRIRYIKRAIDAGANLTGDMP